MCISTRLYLLRMPAWHELIHAEIVRSLILAGSPHPMPALWAAPSSPMQAEAGSCTSQTEGTDASSVPPSSSCIALLARDGHINKQTVESAAADTEPALLHQALLLASLCCRTPQELGACEPDSSESESARSESATSESNQSESASEGTAQAELTTAGLERMLATAILAAYQCCRLHLSVTDHCDGTQLQSTNEVPALNTV